MLELSTIPPKPTPTERTDPIDTLDATSSFFAPHRAQHAGQLTASSLLTETFLAIGIPCEELFDRANTHANRTGTIRAFVCR